MTEPVTDAPIAGEPSIGTLDDQSLIDALLGYRAALHAHRDLQFETLESWLD